MIQGNDTIVLNIPYDIHHGGTIVFKNKGHKIINRDGNEKRGNFTATINFDLDDTIFSITSFDSSSIECDMKISFVEAMCGFSKHIEHPNGSIIYFSSESTIKMDTKYKLVSKGLPSNIKGISGDLYITFFIGSLDATPDQIEQMKKIFPQTHEEKSESDIDGGTLIESISNDKENDDGQSGTPECQTM